MTERYEDLIEELKEIVRRMDDNETTLDECIALYERGAVLVKKCEDLLESAEMKVSMLGRD